MKFVTHPYFPGQIGQVIKSIGNDVLVRWENNFLCWHERHWLRTTNLEN